MTRILVAGFQHETNTFGATKASFEDFLEADGWPGLLRGNEVITGTEGINLPLTGFVDAVRSEPDIELIPVVWASAEPSAHVTDDAFERISTMILEGIRQAGSLDRAHDDACLRFLHIPNLSAYRHGGDRCTLFPHFAKIAFRGNPISGNAAGIVSGAIISAVHRSLSLQRALSTFAAR